MPIYHSKIKTSDTIVIVKSSLDLAPPLSSSKVYLIDGIVDLTGTGVSIEVPPEGLSFRGHTFDVSQIICSDDNYTLFKSPVGGSGNLLGVDCGITISGLNSKVYDLVDTSGFNAFEFSRINYNDCSSLGEINGYRQGLETGTGRFGGSPSLTLSGTWLGGYFIETSIARSLSPAMTEPMFKAGAGFVMNSRFRSNQNIDLPALSAFTDFSESNFPNPSTFQLDSMILTRDGVLNAEDPNINPNTSASSLSSSWISNQGLTNTFVGGRVNVTGGVTTPIITQGVYETLLGTFSTEDLQHFDSPVGGSLRHLGNSPREYAVVTEIELSSFANDELSLRFVKWDDSAGVEIDLTPRSRQVNNVVGNRDVAFFVLTEYITLDRNDYIYLKAANLTGVRDITMESSSYFRASAR